MSKHRIRSKGGSIEGYHRFLFLSGLLVLANYFLFGAFNLFEFSVHPSNTASWPFHLAPLCTLFAVQFLILRIICLYV
jgi:hypothetical protein